MVNRALPRKKPKTINDMAVGGSWRIILEFTDEHGRAKEVGDFNVAESFVRGRDKSEIGHWLHQATRNGLQRFFG